MTGFGAIYCWIAERASRREKFWAIEVVGEVMVERLPEND
jgi:hypothetical protein